MVLKFYRYDGFYFDHRIRYCYNNGSLTMVLLPGGYYLIEHFCKNIMNCEKCLNNNTFCSVSLEEIKRRKSGYYFDERVKLIKGIISLLNEEPI